MLAGEEKKIAIYGGADATLETYKWDHRPENLSEFLLRPRTKDDTVWYFSAENIVLQLQQRDIAMVCVVPLQ